MNKKEFIGALAAKTSSTQVKAGKEVKAIIKTIENVLKKGDKITLKGFGTFSVIEKAERKGLNPRTKEPINIPAHKVVKFKSGATFTGNV
jgi:DNA-binding protein HU-beta